MFISGVVGFILGAVVVGVLAIIFFKNNQNHVAAARSQILDAYSKGETELKSLVDSWKK